MRKWFANLTVRDRHGYHFPVCRCACHRRSFLRLHSLGNTRQHREPPTDREQLGAHAEPRASLGFSRHQRGEVLNRIRRNKGPLLELQRPSWFSSIIGAFYRRSYRTFSDPYCCLILVARFAAWIAAASAARPSGAAEESRVSTRVEAPDVAAPSGDWMERTARHGAGSVEVVRSRADFRWRDAGADSAGSAPGSWTAAAAGTRVADRGADQVDLGGFAGDNRALEGPDSRAAPVAEEPAERTSSAAGIQEARLTCFEVGPAVAESADWAGPAAGIPVALRACLEAELVAADYVGSGSHLADWCSRVGSRSAN